jgi:hypothetical protein
MDLRTVRNTVRFATSLSMLLVLAACAVASEPTTAEPSTVTPPATTPDESALSTTSPAPGASDQAEGAIVRFTAGSYFLDVTVYAESPAVQDFLSMLPLRLPFEELSGREKIAYLPRKLRIDDSPGSDPEDGDLIYFVPWGNLGFYYNADGIDYSDDTLHIGTYNATAKQLEQLQNGQVTVTLVD